MKQRDIGAWISMSDETRTALTQAPVLDEHYCEHPPPAPEMRRFGARRDLADLSCGASHGGFAIPFPRVMRAWRLLNFVGRPHTSPAGSALKVSVVD